MQGTAVTECVVFIATLMLWFFYVAFYFIRRHLVSYGYVKTETHAYVLDIWSTALETRKLWAQDLMEKSSNAQGEALLCVQTMRNIIVASTLLVMGISQVMSRLVIAMITNENLQTINRLVSQDLITGSNVWLPNYVRIAVPFGATLLSLICFGQTARLAIHVGFSVRVYAVWESKRTEDDEENVPLGQEIITMVNRVELYFTLGLRAMYLFAGTIFLTLGLTAFIISSYTVLLILALSDQLWFKRSDHRRRHFSSSYRQEGILMNDGV